MIMSVTYFIALPFIRIEEGRAPGQGQECPESALRSEKLKLCRGTQPMLVPSRSSVPVIPTWAVYRRDHIETIWRGAGQFGRIVAREVQSVARACENEVFHTAC
jgi:hypothetical protein